MLDLLLPPEVIATRKRVMPGHEMRSTEWTCGRCGETLAFREPVRVPAPCPVCGGIVFSTKQADYGEPPPVS